MRWALAVSSAARGKGVVFAFRGTSPDEAEHHFILDGLDAVKQYRLHFEDGSAPDRTVTGGELMSKGLSVQLAKPLSSELVFLTSGTGEPGQ